LFKVTQHERDRALLQRIITVFDCGSISAKSSNSPVLDYRVSGLSTISNKIIPFFTAYPLHGAKALDFTDFHKGISLMNQGGSFD
jgi:hypothetical protein